MREFDKHRETIHNGKQPGRPLLITEKLKNVSAISLQMTFVAVCLQNLKSCLVDNASLETMI